MLPFQLNPASDLTLQTQLYDAVRKAILAGVLRPKTPLPSSRQIARDLSISRNTIVHAFERLAGEGYLIMRPGSGTFVSPLLPDGCVAAADTCSPTAAIDRRPTEKAEVRFPKVLFQSQPLVMSPPGTGKHQIDFRYCSSNWRNFPLREWRQYMIENLSRASMNMSSYCPPEGLLDLRQAIAQHVSLNRAVAVDPDQVIVTAGAQEALNLICRMFVEPGVEVAVETPCYRGALYAFKSYGCSLVPMPVDDEGARVDTLAQSKAALIYVTPSHQFPTGVTMSPRRRLELVRWAERNGAYVIEDDYDSDFRYDGPPLPALAGLHGNASVIYVGTFSKSIGSGVRTGYVIVPKQLIEPTRRAKSLASCGNPWIDQIILADMINRGSFERHLRRLRHAYGETRAALLDALKQHFGCVHVTGSAGGMHIMWKLPRHIPDAEETVALAAREGVGIYTIKQAGAEELGPIHRNRSIVMGYSLLTPEMAESGVARVSRALDHATRSRTH